MSGQLSLNFSLLGGPEVGELPVVVDVLDVGLESAVEPRSVRLASGWSQVLESGTYLARISFPSGEVVRQTCAVHDGDRTELDIDVHALSGFESLERPAILRPLMRDEGTPGLASKAFESTWARRWQGHAVSNWQKMDFDGTTVSRDDHTVRYQFALDMNPQALELGGPHIPWRVVSLPPRSTVDVTISPRGEEDLNVEVTTQNAEAEALLGYLRSGAVEGADATAESLVQSKLGDPIAAAIGGYYLLRTARLDRLSDWGPNLSAWFPWLADGAVINGWQHLHAGRARRGDYEEHFEMAREQLLLATQRGVPVYTEGLRLLIDGLRLLRGDVKDEDQELDSALRFIAPFAVAADWSAATVTYGGENPGRPDTVHREGLPEDRDRLVLLQQVRVSDLIEFGWLSPGARLVSSERPGETAATVTEQGQLDVAGVGRFLSPDTTAEEAFGLQYPGLAWHKWQVESAGDDAPRIEAERRHLGERPFLSQLRQAALGD